MPQLFCLWHMKAGHTNEKAIFYVERLTHCTAKMHCSSFSKVNGYDRLAYRASSREGLKH